MDAAASPFRKRIWKKYDRLSFRRVERIELVT